MDQYYYEPGYMDVSYYNYTARLDTTIQALTIVDLSIQLIQLMAALTYKIREETRLYEIREETRLRTIAEETRLYKIKEA
jgi:hypothetical protein